MKDTIITLVAILMSFAAMMVSLTAMSLYFIDLVWTSLPLALILSATAMVSMVLFFYAIYRGLGFDEEEA